MRPSPEFSARTRNTGISAMRTKPIALGIVQGRSGAPGRVSAGRGPERSRPSSRRVLRRARSTAALRSGAVETAAGGRGGFFIQPDLLDLRQRHRAVAVLLPSGLRLHGRYPLGGELVGVPLLDLPEPLG